MCDLTASHPIPSFLAKRGIRQVGDNVSPGQSVLAPAGLFFTLFKDEILAACVNTHGKGEAAGTGSGVEPVPGAGE